MQKTDLMAEARRINANDPWSPRLAEILDELDALMGDLEYIRFCTELETETLAKKGA
jgi:hypothetical protein